MTKKTNKPKGRPTLLTYPLVNKICARLAEGESLRGICADKDMPDKATVMRWLAANTEFRDQYARAREVQADFWAEQIIEISDTPVEGVRTEDGKDGTKTVREDMLGHRRLQVDTRKWLMARMAPKKYGDRLTQEVSGPAGGPIQTQEVSPRDKLADVLNSLAARGGAGDSSGKPH